MSQIIHNISFPNDGNGDELRTAFGNQNTMNTELYTTKVDKVTGKVLSSNDYTNAEKSKLAGIEAGAEVNVQSDWNQTDNTADDFIKNKPNNLANAVGWIDYADAATTTTPLTLVANVNKKLTNDTLGTFTNTANAPFGVPTIWNSTTNSYDFNFLNVGDTIDIRFDIKVTTTSANQVVKAFLRLAEGTPSQYDIPFTEVQFKTAGTHEIIRPLKIYIGSDIFRTAPASFYVVSDSSATCIVNGWFNEITRKGVNIVTLQADATNLISSDPNNALQLGTDNLLFVPESLPETKITLTDAATTVWNFSTGSYAEWTIGGNRTLSVTNLPSGTVATGTLKLIQDGTGGRTVSFTGNSSDVVIKPTAAAQTLIKFYWDGTNLTWFSENQAGGGSARRYYMRINVDGNTTASVVDTWYSFDRTSANYDNGAFFGVYGTASAPVLSTLFSRGIGITPLPNTKLISAVQRFETLNSWGTATLETQMYTNESADATASTTVSGNQLVTNDSWPATTTGAFTRQRKNLSIQPHSAFTGNTELFIAVRKRVLSGSGMRALEFLLIFEEQ